MLLAIPMKSFSMRGRKVLACHVFGDNPNAFLGKQLRYHSSCGVEKQIRIEGISTASDPLGAVFDFHYSGDEINPDEITEGSLLTDGPLETARQGLKSMSANKGDASIFTN